MKKKMIFWVLAAIILVGAGAGIFIWRRTRSESKQENDSIQVKRGDMQLSVLTTGTVKPQNRLEIKSPIGGRVEEILFREGETVARGQTIAWLSSTERAALLDAARPKGSNELAYWEELYKPMPLMAPINGDIIARNIEPGQTVTSQDVLLVLSDRLIMEAQLDETDIANVKKGQRAEITLDAYPAQTLSGTVDHIAYEAKTMNNVTMYMVDVLPSNIPEFLRSGMTANVRIIMEEKIGVLMIPTDALFTERGSTSVRLVDLDPRVRPSIQKVQTGIRDGKNIEVISGIEEDDTILLRPAFSNYSNKDTARNPFMPTRGTRTGRR